MIGTKQHYARCEPCKWHRDTENMQAAYDAADKHDRDRHIVRGRLRFTAVFGWRAVAR